MPLLTLLHEKRRLSASLQILRKLLLSGFREQSHETGVFDSLGKLTLRFRASAGDAARSDFAIRIDKPLEKLNVLVIHRFDVVLGEEADLFPRSHFLKTHNLLNPF